MEKGFFFNESFFFLNNFGVAFSPSFFLSFFLLCWVFVSVRGLSLVVASGGHSSSRCTGLSVLRPLLLQSAGSRRAGSVVVAHGPSCSAACGIFPDQGSNPCPLHWQAESQPLRHQGSPWKRDLTVGNHAGSESPWPLELQIGVLSHRETHEHVCRSEIHKCDHAVNHLEVLLKHRMLGPTPEFLIQ